MLHPALIPSEAALRGTEPHRLGGQVKNLEQASSLRPGDVVLLGLCNDQGVQANGGRPGAAEGPAGFRKAFFRLDAAWLGHRALWDAGNVPASASYDTFLEAARRVVGTCVQAQAMPLVIGGGHDCSYGTYQGLCDGLGASPAVIAVDAHLDLRPTHGPSSGNPFYRMLEHGLPGEHLVEAGLIPWVNATTHRQYAEEKGVALHFLEPGLEHRALDRVRESLVAFEAKSLRMLATLDLDAFNAASAPGVSAVNPWGLSAGSGLAMAQALGACPAVACLDLMELAPPLDPDGRTARFAAFLAAAFLEARHSRQ
jgi:formimidoylglutamase